MTTPIAPQCGHDSDLHEMVQLRCPDGTLAWHWMCLTCGAASLVPRHVPTYRLHGKLDHDETERAAAIASARIARRGARVVDPTRFRQALDAADDARAWLELRATLPVILTIVVIILALAI